MERGDVKTEIPHLWRDRDRHGNVRLYVAIAGRPKVRIREEVGTPAFWQAYHAALEKILTGSEASAGKRGAPGTLLWLLQRYFLSAEFKALDPRTRRVRKAILEGLAGERFADEPVHGNKPFARMEPVHVRRIRDAKAEHPEAANARVKALRQVFRWASEPTVALAAHNPARDVPYLARRNPDGFHTWSIDEVLAYCKRHPLGTKARLALDLLLFTGVRRSDVVRLGPQMERDGDLHFTETKGRARKVKARILPILPPLRRSIDATPSGHLAYLVTDFGKPFTAAGFGNWFRKRCDEAELQHCSAHGLRKAGATIAANNGATAHQLRAIYGWESLKEAERYTRKADLDRLAREGLLKLWIEQSSDEILPLSAENTPTDR